MELLALGAPLGGKPCERCVCPDLRGANLEYVNFENMDLRNARLDVANLLRVDIFGAFLPGAGLRGAIITDANFNMTSLNGADLSKVCMQATVIADTDLSKTKGLDEVEHSAPSSVGIDTIYRSGGDIPKIFLRGAGVPASFITYARSQVGKAIDYYSCFISYSS
jgi:uncharacterized protein YjbI with pentapeptide repeats